MSAEWDRQRERIIQELEFRLPVMTRPMLAHEMARRMHKWTGIPEKNCGRILRAIAREDRHPHATQDGGIVHIYGRSVVRWRWHPKPQRVVPADDPVIDTSDW